ncbi:hypothetical protein EMGBS1_07020, partial [Chloroflexota bacterium]
MARRSQPAPAAHKIVLLPGQWQAFHNGELAASGLTAALAAAKTSTPAKQPAFLLQQPAEPQAPELPPLCETIARALAGRSHARHMANGRGGAGCVLGAPNHDLDYVTSADALKIARTVARQLNAD